MQWNEMVHLLRATYRIYNEKYTTFAIVGSQSVLGSIENPPKELLVSEEIDIYPIECPKDFDIINATIGEFSSFHALHNYYSDGIDINNIRLPKNWEERAIRKTVSLQDADDTKIIVLFLSLEDAISSKLYAGRPKDYRFIRDAKEAGLVDDNQVMWSLDELDLDFEQYNHLLEIYNNL